MLHLDLLLQVMDLRGEGQGLRLVDPALAQHGVQLLRQRPDGVPHSREFLVRGAHVLGDGEQLSVAQPQGVLVGQHEIGRKEPELGQPPLHHFSGMMPSGTARRGHVLGAGGRDGAQNRQREAE
jgi:hypothetical protein